METESRYWFAFFVVAVALAIWVLWTTGKRR
jgi:hypothetical protein